MFDIKDKIIILNFKKYFHAYPTIIQLSICGKCNWLMATSKMHQSQEKQQNRKKMKSIYTGLVNVQK